ncbi:MAG: hypothetical protein LKM45_05825, partial [Wolbachia endosymbiont of Alcedoecus sp.]|nr:hypothetical protein [Wolbachia endosymbiont of Alcedoecus sp.]
THFPAFFHFFLIHSWGLKYFITKVVSWIPVSSTMMTRKVATWLEQQELGVVVVVCLCLSVAVKPLLFQYFPVVFVATAMLMFHIKILVHVSCLLLLL